MTRSLVHLTPGSLSERLQAGERWQLLDVRETWERDVAAVRSPPFLAIPMADVPARVGELDRAMPVAVLCHAGVRSEKVARWLVSQGFAEVANIDGGIDAWSLEVDSTIARY